MVTKQTRPTVPTLHLLALAGGGESFPAPCRLGRNGNLHHPQHTATVGPAGVCTMGPSAPFGEPGAQSQSPPPLSSSCIPQAQIKHLLVQSQKKKKTSRTPHPCETGIQAGVRMRNPDILGKIRSTSDGENYKGETQSRESWRKPESWMRTVRRKEVKRTPKATQR